MSLKINEIYYSIQGESTYTGKPCIFIRLTYCNLRCTYCDTEHAFYDGKEMAINDIINTIKKWKCNLVEVTGGEPLLQKKCIKLLNALIDNSYKVLLETSGSLPINKVPKQVTKIIDFKCPSSKMKKHNLWEIIDDIQQTDEIKFVISDYIDFKWAKDKIEKYSLLDKCTILFSPTFGKIEPKEIVNWILKYNLNVKMQLQLHKYIWEPNSMGV